VLTRNPNLSPSPDPRPIEKTVQTRFESNWWTGLAPDQCPGFDKKTQTLTCLPLLNLQTCTRQQVLDYFDNSWTLTELLFQSLRSDFVYTTPPYHGLRHPLIFYYGHPAVLYLNKLRVAGLIHISLDPYLEKVLETGVDEMSWDDMSKNEMTWPSVDSVHEFRKKSYQIIRNVILQHPDLDRPSGMDSPLWSLFMGFEHEKIHFETSSVLMRELPLEWLEKPRHWPELNPTLKTREQTLAMADKASWLKISPQSVQWGKSKNTPSYGWDNEYGKRKADLKASEVSPFLITNAEYYEFVKSGRYIKDEHWSAEGLSWRKFRNSKRPTFWTAVGPEGLHDYKLRTLFELIPMPWDWPAEVNFHEAQAYCNWKQKLDKSDLVYRLLTEPEHVALRDKGEDPVLKSGYQERFNFNFSSGSPQPVDQKVPTSSGAYDLFGNVWQWVLDQFNPLDGFEVHPYYDDFSTPCFDGKHQMILGGSFISCGHEASQFARFHFRPHFFQHAGFRIARSLDGSDDNGSTRLINSQDYVHPVRPSALRQMQKSDWWKKVDQPLEFTAQELDQMWSVSVKKMQEWNSNLPLRSPMGTALDGETHHLKSHSKIPYQTTKQFPTRSENFEKNLDLVINDLAPMGQLPGHPGYMGYVAGSPNALSIMAQALSMTLNPYSSHFNMSPGLVALEAEVLKWFIQMTGLPEESAGGLLTTGGSLANLQALAMARQQKLNSSHLGQARFYASEQVHHCIGKALAFLGFPKECLQLIPTDSHFCLRTDLLEKQIQEDLKNQFQPICVVASLGTTNTGAIDPLQDILTIAKKFNLWVHADGAYGLPFLLTAEGKNKLSEVSQVDSLVLDPHKALCLPYGTGLLLAKDRTHLTLDYKGASTYMPPSAGLSDSELRLDFADIGPELSRDWRGLRIWLPLKTLGIEPFQLNLEEKLKLSQYLSGEIKKMDSLQMVAEPQLTILAFKHKNPELTRKLMGQVNSKGRIFLSGCQLKGEFVIRVCLLGHRLHFEQVEILLQDLRESLKELTS
jgi:5-histidylcysteine sulfoxide synthase